MLYTYLYLNAVTFPSHKKNEKLNFNIITIPKRKKAKKIR